MDKSIQGRAESHNWRSKATLRDLLDLLDDIEASGYAPEDKAALRQRVIDYGQHLSEEIFKGNRKVPVSDDNDTIKEFNLRMFSTYDTKGDTKYEEAERPAGYYDNKDEFIANPDKNRNPEEYGARNPRWHPIPLKEGKGPIFPPNDPHVIPSEDSAVVPSSASPGIMRKTMDFLWSWGKFIVPLVAVGALANKCQSDKDIPPETPVKTPDGTILVKVPNTVSEPKIVMGSDQIVSEGDYFGYTVEKGQRMLAKQLGISVDEGAKLYNQFVTNIEKGNIPESLKKLMDSYKMTKMVAPEIGVNVDDPRVGATNVILMAVSYDAARGILLDAIQHPEKPISPANEVKLKKCSSLANAAAKQYGVNPNSNQVAEYDYGLFGATKKTDLQIVFRNQQKDKADYNNTMVNATQKGKNYV